MDPYRHPYRWAFQLTKHISLTLANGVNMDFQIIAETERFA